MQGAWVAESTKNENETHTWNVYAWQYVIFMGIKQSFDDEILLKIRSNPSTIACATVNCLYVCVRVFTILRQNNTRKCQFKRRNMILFRCKSTQLNTYISALSVDLSV